MTAAPTESKQVNVVLAKERYKLYAFFSQKGAKLFRNRIRCNAKLLNQLLLAPYEGTWSAYSLQHYPKARHALGVCKTLLQNPKTRFDDWQELCKEVARRGKVPISNADSSNNNGASTDGSSTTTTTTKTTVTTSMTSQSSQDTATDVHAGTRTLSAPLTGRSDASPALPSVSGSTDSSRQVPVIRPPSQPRFEVADSPLSMQRASPPIIAPPPFISPTEQRAPKLPSHASSTKANPPVSTFRYTGSTHMPSPEEREGQGNSGSSAEFEEVALALSPSGITTALREKEYTPKPSLPASEGNGDEVKSSDKPSDGDKAADKPSGKSADKPSDELNEADDTSSDSTMAIVTPVYNGKPSDTRVEDPRDTPSDSDKPSDKPSDKLSDKLSDKPSDKLSDKPSDEPADKPSDKPSDKLSDKPLQTVTLHDLEHSDSDATDSDDSDIMRARQLLTRADEHIRRSSTSRRDSLSQRRSIATDDEDVYSDSHASPVMRAGNSTGTPAASDVAQGSDNIAQGSGSVFTDTHAQPSRRSPVILSAEQMGIAVDSLPEPRVPVRRASLFKANQGRDGDALTENVEASVKIRRSSTLEPQLKHAHTVKSPVDATTDTAKSPLRSIPQTSRVRSLISKSGKFIPRPHRLAPTVPSQKPSNGRVTSVASPDRTSKSAETHTTTQDPVDTQEGNDSVSEEPGRDQPSTPLSANGTDKHSDLQSLLDGCIGSPSGDSTLMARALASCEPHTGEHTSPTTNGGIAEKLNDRSLRLKLLLKSIAIHQDGKQTEGSDGNTHSKDESQLLQEVKARNAVLDEIVMAIAEENLLQGAATHTAFHDSIQHSQTPRRVPSSLHYTTPRIGDDSVTATEQPFRPRHVMRRTPDNRGSRGSGVVGGDDSDVKVDDGKEAALEGIDGAEVSSNSDKLREIVLPHSRFARLHSPVGGSPRLSMSRSSVAENSPANNTLSPSLSHEEVVLPTPEQLQSASQRELLASYGAGLPVSSQLLKHDSSRALSHPAGALLRRKRRASPLRSPLSPSGTNRSVSLQASPSVASWLANMIKFNAAQRKKAKQRKSAAKHPKKTASKPKPVPLASLKRLATPKTRREKHTYKPAESDSDENSDSAAENEGGMQADEGFTRVRVRGGVSARKRNRPTTRAVSSPRSTVSSDDDEDVPLSARQQHVNFAQSLRGERKDVVKPEVSVKKGRTGLYRTRKTALLSKRQRTRTRTTRKVRSGETGSGETGRSGGDGSRRQTSRMDFSELFGKKTNTKDQGTKRGSNAKSQKTPSDGTKSSAKLSQTGRGAAKKSSGLSEEGDVFADEALSPSWQLNGIGGGGGGTERGNGSVDAKKGEGGIGSETVQESKTTVEEGDDNGDSTSSEEESDVNVFTGMSPIAMVTPAPPTAEVESKAKKETAADTAPPPAPELRAAAAEKSADSAGEPKTARVVVKRNNLNGQLGSHPSQTPRQQSGHPAKLTQHPATHLTRRHRTPKHTGKSPAPQNSTRSTTQPRRRRKNSKKVSSRVLHVDQWVAKRREMTERDKEQNTLSHPRRALPPHTPSQTRTRPRTKRPSQRGKTQNVAGTDRQTSTVRPTRTSGERFELNMLFTPQPDTTSAVPTPNEKDVQPSPAARGRSLSTEVNRLVLSPVPSFTENTLFSPIIDTLSELPPQPAAASATSAATTGGQESSQLSVLQQSRQEREELDAIWGLPEDFSLQDDVSKQPVMTLSADGTSEAEQLPTNPIENGGNDVFQDPIVSAEALFGNANSDAEFSDGVSELLFSGASGNAHKSGNHGKDRGSLILSLQ